MSDLIARLPTSPTEKISQQDEILSAHLFGVEQASGKVVSQFRPSILVAVLVGVILLPQVDKFLSKFAKDYSLIALKAVIVMIVFYILNK